MKIVLGMTLLCLLSGFTGAALMAAGHWDAGLVVWLAAILGWTSLFQWMGRKS